MGIGTLAKNIISQNIFPIVSIIFWINPTIIQTFYSDASSKKCLFYPQWPAFTAGEIWNYVACVEETFWTIWPDFLDCGEETFWTMWLDMKIESLIMIMILKPHWKQKTLSQMLIINDSKTSLETDTCSSFCVWTILCILCKLLHIANFGRLSWETGVW